MDWQGQSYNFLLNFAKYSVNYEQRWTNYKSWSDFGGTWTKTASYYSSNEMLEEITEPCYKFLWWQIEQESQVNFTSPSQSYPSPQTQTTVSWQCDKTKYVGYVNIANLTYITMVADGMFFSPDGTNWYLVCASDDLYLYWFTLTTPWDITTAKYKNKVKYRTLVSYFNTRGSVCFSPDGQNFYMWNNWQVLQFYLSKPWDITTIYSSGKAISNSVDAINVGFNAYGTKMYVNNGGIVEYTLSTAWDVSSVVNSKGDATLSLSGISIYTFNFKPDGSGIYVGDTWGTIYYCDLPTPWSFSNYIYKGVCFNAKNMLNAVGINPTTYMPNFVISNNWKFAYISFHGDNRVYIFTDAS